MHLTITPSVLTELKTHWSPNHSPKTVGCCGWLPVVIGHEYFGFLRCAEFTVLLQQPLTQMHLSLANVLVCRHQSPMNTVVLCLKKSKTDQLIWTKGLHGINLTYTDEPLEICPVSISLICLTTYLSEAHACICKQEPPTSNSTIASGNPSSDTCTLFSRGSESGLHLLTSCERGHF